MTTESEKRTEASIALLAHEALVVGAVAGRHSWEPEALFSAVDSIADRFTGGDDVDRFGCRTALHFLAHQRYLEMRRKLGLAVHPSFNRADES